MTFSLSPPPSQFSFWGAYKTKRETSGVISSSCRVSMDTSCLNAFLCLKGEKICSGPVQRVHSFEWKPCTASQKRLLEHTRKVIKLRTGLLVPGSRNKLFDWKTGSSTKWPGQSQKHKYINWVCFFCFCFGFLLLLLYPVNMLYKADMFTLTTLRLRADFGLFYCYTLHEQQ